MRLRAALAVSVAFVSVNAFAYDAHAKPYKGAEVYGRDPVLHGRVEARMRMASGSGVLTTLFLYKDGSEKAGAYWEEIDVEIFGKDNASSWQSNIIWGQPRSTAEEVHTHPTSLAEAYHTYTVEWTPTSLSWRLDGVEVRRADGAGPAGLTNPQTIRFNLWISDSPAWAGALDPAALPTYQFVNWVKYYRYEDGEFILDWTDDFDTFDTKRWGKANWTCGRSFNLAARASAC